MTCMQTCSMHAAQRAVAYAQPPTLPAACQPSPARLLTMVAGGGPQELGSIGTGIKRPPEAAPHVLLLLDCFPI